jgi:Ca-activated chloride channel homolog
VNALFESLTGLRLLDPWLLALALLLPVVLLLRRRRPAPSILFAPAPLLRRDAGGPAMPTSWRVRLLPLPRVLQVLGVLLAIVALARPARTDRLPLETEGIDIVLVLDTSSSMSLPMAGDEAGPRRSRLAVAKEAAAQFVAGRRDDRIGLVSFARCPDLRCPPTLDHVALRTILAGVSAVASDGAEDATGIGTAVARATQVLRNSVARGRVVILLTDGEENVATVQTPAEIAPLHAGQFAEKAGVRVYTIAAGSDGAPSRGSVDTTQVQRLSTRTGGRFYAARDAEAMAAVYAEIDALEKVPLEEPRFRVEERFLPFLAAGLASLALAIALRWSVLAVLP